MPNSISIFQRIHPFVMSRHIFFIYLFKSFTLCGNVCFYFCEFHKSYDFDMCVLAEVNQIGDPSAVNDGAGSHTCSTKYGTISSRKWQHPEQQHLQ